jgi:hypothetical protein
MLFDNLDLKFFVRILKTVKFWPTLFLTLLDLTAYITASLLIGNVAKTVFNNR